MRDWIDIVGDKINEAKLPLPDNDWEWYEAKFIQRKKIKIIKWSALSISMVSLVAVLLIVIRPKTPGSDVANPPASHSQLLSELNNSSEKFHVIDHYSKFGAVEKISARPVESTNRCEADTLDKDNEVVSGQFEIPDSLVISNPGSANNTKYTNNDISIVASEKNKGAIKLSVSPFLGGLTKIQKIKPLNGTTYLGAYFGGIAYSSIHHVIPLSVGIDVSLTTSNKLSLTSGLDFTFYKSVFSDDYDDYVQRAYYLGIPLRLDWSFWEVGPVSAQLGIGGKVDRLVYAKFNHNNLKDNSFHWSLVSIAKVQYELLPGLNVFFQPEFSYYFRPANPTINTYRTEHPRMITFEAGLSIAL